MQPGRLHSVKIQQYFTDIIYIFWIKKFAIIDDINLSLFISWLPIVHWRCGAENNKKWHSSLHLQAVPPMKLIWLCLVWQIRISAIVNTYHQ